MNPELAGDGVAALLIRRARLVPVGTPAPAEPVDVRIEDGRITEVAPALVPRSGEQVVDADGRWAIPGLWDHHVHMAQWAQTRRRLDVSGCTHPSQVVRIVAEHVAQLPADAGPTLVVGSGYRSATWPEPPTVAALDAVSEAHPVVLISGDGHNGWLSSAALRLLGLPARDGALDENEWFAAWARVGSLPGAEVDEAGYRDAVAAASALGVVGVVDMELAAGYRDWPQRFGRGVDRLRVRVSTYPDRLDEVLAAGLRSGDPLPGGAGLLTMGPLKIISDGSLNTRTAYCVQPYAGGLSEHPRGKHNYPAARLVELLGRARAGGLTAAVHAIGDAAVSVALDVFETTGATGSIEHAQLMASEDIARMAALGVRASMQPAHLLDDRDVTEQLWPHSADRCFLLRSMHTAGVTLALGSDAPVAPLDPWLAMAAAVHRSADDREPWNPAEALTAAEALAASTDGRGALAVGQPGDVVLLDDDPLRVTGSTGEVAAHLRAIPVAATFVAGRATHSTL